MSAARVAFAALCLVLSSGPALAHACTAPPADNVAPIARSVWKDTGKFGFLVGREAADNTNGMTLMTRLRALPAFAEVRAGAEVWNSAFILSSFSTTRIAELAGYVRILEALCKELDDTDFSETTLDRNDWNERLDDIRVRVDDARAPLASFNHRNHAFAVALDVASKAYAAKNYPLNRFASIGPDPADIAVAVADFDRRWRDVMVDLDFLAETLKSAPGDGSNDEKASELLTSAATTLDSVVAQAAAISMNAMPFEDFKHFSGGDYLYDTCAAIDGRLFRLENLFYGKTDGVLTWRNSRLTVQPRGGAGNESGQLWRFDKVQNGYWSISLELDQRKAYLDISTQANGVGHDVILSAGRELQPSRSSQIWRCYDAGGFGAFRFSNGQLGETFSIDTYSNDPQAIMAPTGNFGAQYWRVRQQ